MPSSHSERLYKLVDFLLKHGIMEAKDIAKLFGMSIKEFYHEFIERV